MADIIAGFPAPLPFGIDFVTYSNEDLGFITPYSGGVDVFQFPLPYPSSMNLWEESLILFCMESIFHAQSRSQAALTVTGMIQHLSMLGDDFGPNWEGALADAEDETFKAQFAGPDYFGQVSQNLLATANISVTELKQDINQNIKYYPPEPLDLVTPLYINWTNASGNFTLATGASTHDDDAAPNDSVAIRVWFLKRDYTPMEKAFLQRLPTRFQQLDS